MSKVSHVVKEIIPGTVKSGYHAGKPYWTIITTTGNRLTCFEEPYMRGVEPGKEYEFMIEASQDGKYVNLVGESVEVWRPSEETQIKARGSDASARNTASNIEQPEEMNYGEKERMYKNRISALQAAVNYIVGCMAGTHSDEDLIDTTKRFEEYINTGQ